MRKGKLVRDKIPEIIEKDGKKPITRIASRTECEARLGEKLQEEVSEFLESGKTEELADILEVIRAICDLRGISHEDLEKIRNKKLEERGGFKKRIILERISGQK